MGEEPTQDAGPVTARISDGGDSIDVDADGGAPLDAEPPVEQWLSDTDTTVSPGWFVIDDQVRQAQFQPGLLPSSPLQSQVARPTPSRPLSTTDVILASAPPPSVSLDSSSVVTVSAFQPLVLPTSAGVDSLLLATNATSGQNRHPTASENIIAGRRKGQTPGGSYWIPTREDLDTMLSKIDSRIVENVTVVKGPYNVVEGPGLAFFDVELLRAPRFEDGYESHGLSLLEYQTNGEQWHGRQSLSGGSANWGYRIGYSHRTGSDYESGNTHGVYDQL